MAVNFVKADTFDAASDYEASTNLYPHFRHLLTDLDEIWYMRAAGNAAEFRENRRTEGRTYLTA